LVPYVDGFSVHLGQQGYAPSTVLIHLRRMGRLSRWLDGQGLDVSALRPVTINGFLAERWPDCSARSLAPLFGYLRAVGVMPGEEHPIVTSAVDVMLARYAGYLARERGLTEATITRNVGLVRPFLVAQLHDGHLDLGRLTAGEVTAFVLEQSRQRPGGVPRLATALRSLLRFLHAEGLAESGLADAVLPVAKWKQAGLPQALRTEQVAALLASCDLRTAVGRRDLAVLTVLSRLGLRAGEVARLQLDDIDWRRGEITVTGSKGGRRERLPLPVDVGSVIVSYLTDGRPDTTLWPVFLCARAPHRAMSRGAVTNVVARAASKAGLGTVHAHRLRHSTATAMLSAGASLTEIGQLLRHRHALTTTIYLKVDIEGLRTLARAWPSESAA
jgi:site-specific recombinase XerD